MKLVFKRMKAKNTLYYQVMLKLKQKIQDGEYPVDSKLPTESELQDEFGVSRVTLRKAINQLTTEGLIEKIQGNGSYVRKPGKVKKLLRLNSVEGFSYTAKKNGFLPSSKIINFAQIIPSRRIQNIFRLNSSTCLNIKRVLFLDEQPVIVDDSYILAPFYEFLQKSDIEISLYEALKKNPLIKKLSPQETLVSATEADKELSDLLAKPFGCSLLNIDNVLKNQDGKMVQCSEEFVDPDVYQIRIR